MKADKTELTEKKVQKDLASKKNETLLVLLSLFSFLSIYQISSSYVFIVSCFLDEKNKNFYLLPFLK